MPRSKTVAHYRRMINRHPWVSWWIECYHYETRTYSVYVSDGNGGGHYETRTEQVKVVTHTCSRVHQINAWSDASFPFGDVRHKMTKLKMSRHFMWSVYQFRLQPRFTCFVPLCYHVPRV
jgi:hypothetical protein